MLHINLCSFQLTHGVKLRTTYLSTTYHNTTNHSRYLPHLELLWSHDILAANYHITNITFVMFHEGRRVYFGLLFKISSFLFNANTAYGMLNNNHSPCYISHVFCILRMHASLYSSQVKPLTDPFICPPLQSHFNSSSTIHFNTCVCWLEIRVQITRVAICTFFCITITKVSAHFSNSFVFDRIICVYIYIYIYIYIYNIYIRTVFLLLYSEF